MMNDQLPIEIGDQVYLEDGGEEVGDVREVLPDTRELILYIENSRDFRVGLEAIRDAHSRKVILREENLSPELREAIRHAHDAEDRPSG